MVVLDEDDYIAHYGVKRRSGRYKWGSGGDSEISVARNFQSDLVGLRSAGWKDKEIQKAFGMTSTELRANIAVSGAYIKQDNSNRVKAMSLAGNSNMHIQRETGIPEATIRSLLKPDADARADQLTRIADVIKKRVDADGFIDIGKGVYHGLGITKTKFETAVAMLTNDGYFKQAVLQPQVTNPHDTRVLVLAKPGNDWASVNANKHLIQPLMVFSNDSGKTFELAQEPLQLNPKRLDIVYGPEGGSHADGAIFIRPGIRDLDMGAANYAQVRIAVGAKHFIKGMAIKKEGLPDGVDVQFHTTKERKADKMAALKEIKEGGDPIERFGAIFRQLTNPKSGKVESHLNIVNDDDDWEDWSKSLASQMLSKQKPDFVKSQLEVTFAKKKADLEEIMSLTNPIVKKKLLESYSEDMDSSAVHLKAAALPRQKTHVILPIKSLKDHEVYAPGYNDGESVVLIRYPHGGKFEIPELIVNNRNREGKALITPTSRAAIGINSTVAKRLSGADFDGDTVVVIPNERKRVSSEHSLAKLQGFDPQVNYRGMDSHTNEMLPGVKRMSNTQTEMGVISNLITDMTIAGATHEELARAVKHSMVVIDAEKHGLDWKRSYEENTIKSLKQRYQPGKNYGATTIISRSGGKKKIPALMLRPEADGGHIDKKTGELIYVPQTKNVPIKDPKTGEITWVRQLATRDVRKVDKKTGEVTWVPMPKTERAKSGTRKPGIMVNGKQVTDGYDLTSKGRLSPAVERHYADYSNRVRQLANEARLAYTRTSNPLVNPSAKKVYKAEIDSLKAKLVKAQSNAPRERQAQQAAQILIKVKKAGDPGMSDEQLKRVKISAVRTMRKRMGADPYRVEFTPKEWEAVQSGAVASSVLRELLTKADMDKVRQLATPKTSLLMQPSNVGLAKSLLANGRYTRAEVAKELGVSLSTLDRSIK